MTRLIKTIVTLLILITPLLSVSKDNSSNQTKPKKQEKKKVEKTSDEIKKYLKKMNSTNTPVDDLDKIEMIWNACMADPKSVEGITFMMPMFIWKRAPFNDNKLICYPYIPNIGAMLGMFPAYIETTFNEYAPSESYAFIKIEFVTSDYDNLYFNLIGLRSFNP